MNESKAFKKVINRSLELEAAKDKRRKTTMGNVNNDLEELGVRNWRKKLVNRKEWLTVEK